VIQSSCTSPDAVSNNACRCPTATCVNFFSRKNDRANEKGALGFVENVISFALSLFAFEALLQLRQREIYLLNNQTIKFLLLREKA
jgi:hypothetical protein